MSADARESATHPRVIIIPWLINDGVVGPEVLDKGADTKSIYDHGQGIPLGHLLLDAKEVTHTISCYDHQGGPVAVVVKCTPHTTGPLVLHHP